jgi:hypothetical protein
MASNDENVIEHILRLGKIELMLSVIQSEES